MENSYTLQKRILIIIPLIIFLSVFIFLFFTREIQYELPYVVSGSEILEIKEKCQQLALKKEIELARIYDLELIGSGYSEKGGFCYMEYFNYFEDWTSKTLYNLTDDKQIITRRWPEDESWYQRGFDWYVLGKKRFYQKTF